MNNTCCAVNTKLDEEQNELMANIRGNLCKIVIQYVLQMFSNHKSLYL